MVNSCANERLIIAGVDLGRDGQAQTSQASPDADAAGVRGDTIHAMITPSPTTKIAPTLARGVNGGMTQATVGRPSCLIFEVPNTSYQVYLRPEGEITAAQGKRLIGIIKAQAKRIDVVTTGGQYVEPVMGRPRRVQGTVVAVEGGAVVVDAGMPIHCTPTDPRQSASQFQVGQFVSFDVMDGASFKPQA
jgi:hypothetical protein